VRDDRERLLDILDAIGKIERRMPVRREALDEDELLQVWMVHHVQVIGEAVRGLSEGFRARHPEVPWREIVTMRNVLVHHYFDVDTEEVWQAATRDLPPLKRTIEALLRELGGPAEAT